MGARKTPAADKFSYPEYLRLHEKEGLTDTEIIKIFGMSRAAFYRYLNMAREGTLDAFKEGTRNQAAKNLTELGVEHVINAHFKRIYDMLDSAPRNSKEWDDFYTAAHELHYTTLANLADAACLAKKLSAYLKSTETTE